MRVNRDWNEIGNGWKVDGKKLKRIGEFARGGGDGSNARKRGEYQADVLYMVFVLKTGKYGMKNDFPIENCWRNRKNLKRC